MSPTVRVISVIVLVYLVVQIVGGNQKIVYVSKSISDDEDFFTGGDGNSSVMCCVYGKSTCNSFYHALANLTSNVLINVITDVTLSSLINAPNLENVSIIGHNNPTVSCKKTGGLHCNICHNCIIKDITWDGCGSETESGIKLGDSSITVIINCSFQYSKGPAITLSGVSGNVNISHCNFVHSNDFGGYGAALHVHISSVDCINHIQLRYTISDCNFTHNNYSKSIVYCTSDY